MKGEIALKDGHGVTLASLVKPGKEGDWVALPRFSQAFKEEHPEARIGDYMNHRLEFCPPLAMESRSELRFYELPSAPNSRKRLCSVICLRDEINPTIGE